MADTMKLATVHAVRLGINLALAGAVIAALAHYPGLVAPAAIALGLWYGMIGLAHVHPRAAWLIYCAVCGCLGVRPYRCSEARPPT
jgi:hypothetical protein